MESLSEDQKAKIMEQTASNLSLLNIFVEAIQSNPAQTLGEFFRTWRNKVGYTKGYAPFNTGVILTSLWGLIVLPYEQFVKNNPKLKIPLKNLDENEWGKIQINEWKSKKSKNLQGLLYHLRNAVSHVLVAVDENLYFTFQDRPNENAEMNFEVVMEVNELRKFILRLGPERIATLIDEDREG